MYFLIQNIDGDTTVTPLSAEELSRKLNPAEDSDYRPDDFLAAAPKERDTNYWGERKVLLIKGEVITPHAEEVVTRVAFD